MGYLTGSFAGLGRRAPSRAGYGGRPEGQVAPLFYYRRSRTAAWRPRTCCPERTSREGHEPKWASVGGTPPATPTVRTPASATALGRPASATALWRSAGSLWCATTALRRPATAVRRPTTAALWGAAFRVTEPLGADLAGDGRERGRGPQLYLDHRSHFLLRRKDQPFRQVSRCASDLARHRRHRLWHPRVLC